MRTNRSFSRLRWTLPLLALWIGSPEVYARNNPGRIGLSLRTGTALSASSPLNIRQVGSAPITFTAQYDTNPFEGSFFYDIRLAVWGEEHGWCLQIIHHKLYLNNPPPEVTFFTITDGYNFALGKRLWSLGKGWILGAGAGVVVTHPESEINGQRFSETGGELGGGYYISGPAFNVSLGYELSLTDWFQLSAEGGTTASFVNVPISGGTAFLPNYMGYLVAGFSFRFL